MPGRNLSVHNTLPVRHPGSYSYKWEMKEYNAAYTLNRSQVLWYDENRKSLVLIATGPLELKDRNYKSRSRTHITKVRIL